MATIYEIDLCPQLAREMGDVDTTNLYYSASQLYSAINDGKNEFNILSPDQQYSIVGSGDTAYFSPDPSIEDQRILVLCAAMVLTRGEVQKSARSAFSHSNPAGSTNLTRIPEMLMKQLEILENRITILFSQRCRQLVEEESCGEELKGRPTEVAEGVGITTVETTN